MLVRKCPRSSRLFWNITRIMLIEAEFWYSVMMCGRRLERGQWPWVRPQAWNSRSAPPPWWPGLVAHLGAAGDISVQGLPKSWWAVLLQKRGAIHKHFRMHLVRTSVKGYVDWKIYFAHLSRLAAILRFTCSSSHLLYTLCQRASIIVPLSWWFETIPFTKTLITDFHNYGRKNIKTLLCNHFGAGNISLLNVIIFW